MDREAWRPVIHGVTKSRTRLRTELNRTEPMVPQSVTLFGDWGLFRANQVKMRSSGRALIQYD